MKRGVGVLGPGEFAKYHALGNDYIVFDSATCGVLSGTRIQALCDRHVGVGSDGILLRVAAPDADFGLRIFNPDGSEAEKSGNGLRIFARSLFDLGYTQASRFSIETPGGLVHATLEMQGRDVHLVEVDMGQAHFDSSAVGMVGPARLVVDELLPLGDTAWPITAVSLGNPHCVCFVAHLDVQTLRRLGPVIEHHPSFTRRTNVQFVQVTHRGRLDILIWERGAGETRASGSSSCAAAVAARRAGRVDASVEVHMPGGVLEVAVDADYRVVLRGPATPVYRGVLL